MFARVRNGVGVTGLALALLSASPAEAKDEFEDGFKDELGRIAAHEAVGVGRQVLAGFLLAGPQVAAPAPYRAPVYGYGHSGDYGYDPRPYGRTVVHRHDHYYQPVRYDHGHRGHGWGHRHGHHKHYKHHKRHHHGGHDCD
jgi:hypothetical protein